MKAAIFKEPSNIKIEEVADPVIQQPDDAIVRVTYACICGSDLWYYRGLAARDNNSRIGHEFMGIVEAVGENVKHAKVGDLVVAPFVISDGTCPECLAGMTTGCRNIQSWGAKGNDGGQGEKVRVPLANGTLFVIPKDKVTEEMMPKLLPLSDVLCTGHHAAVSGRVGKGSTVAVSGDGAVGLCAVAASKRLGASRIFLISTHPDRAAIGKKFGATDIVDMRGEAAIKFIKDATDNLGVDSALECVGTEESWNTIFGITRKGGNIGVVGLPVKVSDLPITKFFWPNIGIKGSAAPAAHYIPELMPDVLSGKLDVSDIFTKTIPIDEVAEGYRDMDERKEIKILIKM